MKPEIEEHVNWDIGTAYDFFISLWVLHEPEQLGLRGSWAAGVRSRLPAPERELLQRVTPIIRPLPWVYLLPEPKDVPTALAHLRALDSADRLMALVLNSPEPVKELLRDVMQRGAWSEADQREMAGELQSGNNWTKHPAAAVRKIAGELLELWADPDNTANGLLSAYECYYSEFFAEEETRIRPALEAALTRGRQTAARTKELKPLLEELSQGVRIARDWKDKMLVLAPSYWATPLAFIADFPPDNLLFLFGARPTDQSLIPGEVVPDALYQALKALADPTRLRILRYLNDEPLTPAELARRLRLRAPTVIHHLDALRLARLVIITLEREGKRYTIRPDAVDTVCELLNQFLIGREE